MQLPTHPNQVGPVCLVTGGNGYVGKHLALAQLLGGDALRIGHLSHREATEISDTALDWLDRIGPRQLLDRSLHALDSLLTGCRDLPDVRVLDPASAQRTPVASIVHAGYDALELGNILACQGVVADDFEAGAR